MAAPWQNGKIELVSVTKQYTPGAPPAVADLDLTVDHGAYCCLLGPSGCGKTTILRMVAGHEEPTSGDVLIGDRNVTGLPPVERGTAMMFQSYALFPHRSVLDNVAFALKMRGLGKARAQRDRARTAGKGAVGGIRQPHALRTLGRPAAARRAGAGADHQPARAAAG